MKKFFSKFNIFLTALLLLGVSVSIITIVNAATPNPGHPWTETGDGVFAITGPTALRTFTFPDSNATVATLQSSPAFTGTITAGAVGGTTGALLLRGTTSGTVTLTAAATAGTYTLTLPTDDGTPSQFLQTDGSGTLIWASISGGGDALVANPLSQFASTTSAQLAGVISDETGTDLAVFSNSPVFTDDFDLGAAGVKLTGSAGTLTFLGLGSGSDENLILDLDTVSDVGTFTSSTSLATLNFSSIALQESGIAVLNNDEIDSSAELLAIMDDETGTGLLVFATNPTFTGATLSGSLTLNENAAILQDPALSADGTYNGIIRAGTAGATLAFGDLVYLDPTDSRWELADANAAVGADGDATGILGIVVLAAAADGDPTTILLHGIVRADTAFPAMTVNAPMYVSETAGDIVGTQPTTTDVVIKVIGFPLTADELFFSPSNDYMTHI